jgi:hypothetical protein
VTLSKAPFMEEVSIAINPSNDPCSVLSPSPG